MNHWTKQSIEFAQQRNYLDELFKVYPLNPNLRRELSKIQIDKISSAYEQRDNVQLIQTLLEAELFPLKDSYIPFLRHDRDAITRNPQTVNRIAGNLYQMGLETIIEKCTNPKETNRQIGPLFKNWIQKNTIGVPILKDADEFLSSNINCILNSSDSAMQIFARDYLGFIRDKGVDFLAKFNSRYIVGEAKFLTDFGGHQNAQFEDALSSIHSFKGKKQIENEVIPVAILDGVLYIKGRNKMHEYIINHRKDNIFSALVLREFLYSL
ncbi:MAG: hypothetical protein IJT20_07080 [Synergistaceae bacterium]|nr:hypothetical protein [Synergistaceae bacterium]